MKYMQVYNMLKKAGVFPHDQVQAVETFYNGLQNAAGKVAQKIQNSPIGQIWDKFQTLWNTSQPEDNTKYHWSNIEPYLHTAYKTTGPGQQARKRLVVQQWRNLRGKIQHDDFVQAQRNWNRKYK